MDKETKETTNGAVEALARAIYCLSPADEMPIGLIKEMAAKACLERITAQGYTLCRETMTEAELERELMDKSFSVVGGRIIGVDTARELAKKFRG